MKRKRKRKRKKTREESKKRRRRKKKRKNTKRRMRKKVRKNQRTKKNGRTQVCLQIGWKDLRNSKTRKRSCSTTGAMGTASVQGWPASIRRLAHVGWCTVYRGMALLSSAVRWRALRNYGACSSP